MRFAESSLGRPNLSREVQPELRRRIITGDLAPGARLNEVELAESLHLSRTPLREALSQLTGDGLVMQLPRRGFFVTELTAEEVREIYPIRQLLDPEALKQSGIPKPRVLKRLHQLNQQILEGADPRTIVELDDRWHLELISRCRNQVLVGLIKQFMDRTRRYELAYRSGRSNLPVVVREHRHILSFLESGDLEGACRALRDNLASAEEPILARLAQREAKNAR